MNEQLCRTAVKRTSNFIYTQLTFTSLLELFNRGFMRSSLRSSAGLLKGRHGNVERSKYTRTGT